MSRKMCRSCRSRQDDVEFESEGFTRIDERGGVKAIGRKGAVRRLARFQQSLERQAKERGAFWPNAKPTPENLARLNRDWCQTTGDMYSLAESVNWIEAFAEDAADNASAASDLSAGRGEGGLGGLTPRGDAIYKLATEDPDFEGPPSNLLRTKAARDVFEAVRATVPLFVAAAAPIVEFVERYPETLDAPNFEIHASGIVGLYHGMLEVERELPGRDADPPILYYKIFGAHVTPPWLAERRAKWLGQGERAAAGILKALDRNAAKSEFIDAAASNEGWSSILGWLENRDSRLLRAVPPEFRVEFAKGIATASQACCRRALTLRRAERGFGELLEELLCRVEARRRPRR